MKVQESSPNFAVKKPEDSVASVGKHEDNTTAADDALISEEEISGTCPGGPDGMLLTQSDFPDNEVVEDLYDLEDVLGLHTYPYPENQRPNNDGIEGNGSTITSSNGETPEYFALPTEDIKVDRKKFTGNYRCLLPDRALYTEVVDDMITLMVKIHGLEQKITFANYVNYKNAATATVDSLRQLCSWAISSQALNSDIIIVDIHITTPPHFLLGVILWEKQRVIILNSLPGCPKDYDPIFRNLYRILLVAKVVAGDYIYLSRWSNYVENGVEHQRDGISCGLYAILNAYSICARVPYFTSTESGISLDTVRSWVLKCLMHPEVHRPVQIRMPGQLVKLTPKEKELNAKKVLAVPVRPMSWTEEASKVAIDASLRTTKYFKGRYCQALECAGKDTTAQSLMCVECRMWFHMECVTLEGKPPTFFYCPDCGSFRANQFETSIVDDNEIIFDDDGSRHSE